MTLVKICSIILFYFLSRVALSASCETFNGVKSQETVCWNETVKGWVSESCNNLNKKCDARDFFSTQKPALKSHPISGGRNPAAVACHDLKLDVIVLKDLHNNEKSFCVFKDKTLVSSSAVENFIE
jgi:hypothetical protein